jgi:hypothetical protein
MLCFHRHGLRGGLLVALTAFMALLAGAIGTTPARAEFGLSSFAAELLNADSSPVILAGSHPYRLTTTFSLNAVDVPPAGTDVDGRLKDVAVDLPPGVVGDASAVPACTQAQIAGTNECPVASQVGIAVLHEASLSPKTYTVGVFNVVPPKGVAAEFELIVEGVPIQLLSTVSAENGYHVRTVVANISQAIVFDRTKVTIWGVPAAASHDAQRGDGFNCDGDPEEPPANCVGGGHSVTGEPVRPLLTAPTSCGSPLDAQIQVDSWQNPGQWHPASATMTPGMTAASCEELPFDPTISLRPTTRKAAAPSGMDVELSLPQEGLENPNLPATADLKKAVVTLPAGITLNPASAGGLTACSEAQIGLISESPVRFNDAEPSCPESSQVGTAEVSTPLLSKRNGDGTVQTDAQGNPIPDPLEGELYIAAQNENPSHSLLAGYMVIQGQGALIKLAGSFALDANTGQITATFDENPQQPFSDLKLHFKGGSRGVLITPPSCGSYATSSVLTPWSAPSGPGVSLPGSLTFDESCATGGFAPSFTAGTVSNAAGSFSPFLLSFSRSDAEQQIKGLSFTMPPGASAKLAGVPLCSDADAAAGTCPESSRIGSVTVGSGAGSDPFFLKGSVYLTGPYNGGPFGEAVVVPANAGPFHLGNVVVRGSIGIDPHTAQPTIVSDPFPQFVGSTGIPTDIRRVDVTLDRPGFTFNPTNCEPHAVNGTLTSAQGASATVSSAFQAANCATLRFAPKFQVSTSGKPSKADGASLSARVSYPTAPFGTQANITRVKVDLPKQLPSRLTTLQKACTAAQFESNPAGCPAASVIGHARAITPILPVPLEGPAYFVSHGGEAFPSLIIVLQGYGVRIDLVGTTFINKAGITSSTFKTVPDQPVTSFELTLPQGRFSALAANGNLCASTKTVTVSKRVTRRVHGHNRRVTVKVKKSVAAALVMPTEFVAQNGATIHQTTPVTVTGCPKAKKATKATKKKHNGKKVSKKVRRKG